MLFGVIFNATVTAMSLVTVKAAPVVADRSLQSQNNKFTDGFTPVIVGVFYPEKARDADMVSLAASIKVAAGIAEDQINSDPSLLRSFKLRLKFHDTKCIARQGTQSLFETMQERRGIDNSFLFGDACTSVNEPIGMASSYFNTIQVSYADNHPKFSSKEYNKYPTFLRIVPGEYTSREVRYSFLQYFNWTRVATFPESDEPRVALMNEAFTGNYICPNNQTCLIASKGFSSRKSIYDLLRTNLEELKSKDARIILAFITTKYAVEVFCQIYNMDLYGSKYVWIFHGHQSDNWWKDANITENENCTRERFTTAMQGHFIIEYPTFRSDRQSAVGQMSVPQFENQYLQRCQSEPNCDPQNKFVGYTYDGVWLIARTIDKAIAQGVKFLPNNTLNTSEILEIISNPDSSFEGLTGNVAFLNNERLGIMRIAQFQGDRYVTVGEYNADDDHIWFNESRIYWKGGKIPVDGNTKVYVGRYIHFAIFCTMCAITVICLVLAFTFLAINIAFRSHRFIKMSSPNINNLIIIGSVLIYASVILLGLDSQLLTLESYETLCTIKTWIFSFGFTLSFGAMFSKTWRVHSIFTNIKLNKKAIKDFQLYLIVFGLLFVDFIILLAWLILDPMYVAKIELQPEIDDAKNVIIIPEYEKCASKDQKIFQGIMFAYKGLLLLLGCYLAWETRNVNVPALNDSKFIGMSVYNVVLMCLLGLGLSFTLETQINYSYLFLSIFIIFCTTLTLILVFGPKMMELKRNPKGNDRRYKATMMMKSDCGNKRRFSEDEDSVMRERMLQVQMDLDVWKRLLEERDHDVGELYHALRDLGAPMPEDNSTTFKDSAIAIEDNYSGRDHSDPSQIPFGGVYIGVEPQHVKKTSASSKQPSSSSKNLDTYLIYEAQQNSLASGTKPTESTQLISRKPYSQSMKNRNDQRLNQVPSDADHSSSYYSLCKLDRGLHSDSHTPSWRSCSRDASQDVIMRHSKTLPLIDEVYATSDIAHHQKPRGLLKEASTTTSNVQPFRGSKSFQSAISTDQSFITADGSPMRLFEIDDNITRKINKQLIIRQRHSDIEIRLPDIEASPDATPTKEYLIGDYGTFQDTERLMRQSPLLQRQNSKLTMSWVKQTAKDMILRKNHAKVDDICTRNVRFESQSHTEDMTFVRDNIWPRIMVNTLDYQRFMIFLNEADDSAV